jgi:hypothetical protein
MTAAELILFLFEILAFVASMYTFKKLPEPYLKVFVGLLGFIVLSEVLGKLFKYSIANTSINVIWYGFISIPIQFITYYWLYSKRVKNRLLFIIPSSTYVLSLLINLLMNWGEEYIFPSVTYTIGNILLLIVIFRYLYLLMNSNDILHFKRDPFFWISIGQLIFYLPTIPFYFFMYQLYNTDVNFYINYYYFAIGLNCIMYVFYTLSFIWKRTN